MAEQHPGFSRYGREIKPTAKMREFKKDQALRLYQKSLMHVSTVSKDLLNDVHEDAGEVVERIYSSWRLMLDELNELEDDYRGYLNSRELQDHVESYRGDMRYIHLVRERVEDYIQEVKRRPIRRRNPEPEVVQKQSYRSKLEEDTFALEEEIKKIELSLSKNAADLERRRQMDSSSPINRRLDYAGVTPKSSTPFDGGLPNMNPTYSRIREAENPAGYERHYEYRHVPSRLDEYDVDYRDRNREADYYRRTDPEAPSYRSVQSSRAGARHEEGRSRTHMSTFDRPPSARELPRRSEKGSSMNDTENILSRLVNVLQEGRERKLPSMEPDKFEGDIMQFPSWITSFESLVEKKYKSAGERLFYLGRYTTGEAHDVISEFKDFDTDDAYVRAKMLLITRYGDKIKISEAYKRKLFTWPVIKPGERQSLQKLSDFLWKCQKAMDTIGYMSSLNAPDENKKILARLPFHIVDRWNRVIDLWVYNTPKVDTQMIVTQCGEFPPFLEFCRFMSGEARIANGPCSVGEITADKPSAAAATKAQSSSRGAKKGVTLSTKAEEPVKEDRSKAKKDEKKNFTPRQDSGEQRPPLKCIYCGAEHALAFCISFLEQSADEKKKFALEKGACFGCLRRGHTFRTCRIKRPSLLKDGVPPELKDEKYEDKGSANQTTPKVMSLTTNLMRSHGLSSMILPVYVGYNGVDEVKTYMVVDSQSDSCFVSQSVVDGLKVKPGSTEIRLTTMGATSLMQCGVLDKLHVRGVHEDKSVCIPRCYTRSDDIPARRDSIPDLNEIKKWPYLKKVADEMMEADEDMSVGLLLGYNCSEAFFPVDYKVREMHEPFGFRSPFGWSIMGQLGIMQDAENHQCFNTSVREVTSSDVKRVFDMHFETTLSDQKLSQEDTRFMKVMRETIEQKEDDHFQIELPMKKENPELPNNKKMAEKRLGSLQKKLLKDDVYSSRYRDFVNEMIESGKAEIIADDDDNEEEGMIWYLPHMGVYHPRKPTKLRVVFDASAAFLSRSLNECLLSGPDQTNKLVGVLLRFRKEKYAMMCDVEKMFHQVVVAPKHRNLIRFLWYKDGNPLSEVQEMRMMVHLFGATSSPGCANYAFQEVARRFGGEYGETTATFILRHFYVDDGLVSLKTEDEIIDLVFSSHSLCKRGGFNLLKYTSNSKYVLDHIPEKLQAKEVKEWKMKGDALPVETTLGVKWSMEKDSFIFEVNLKEQESTRRGMLSALASIYDPLGLISPVILKGRMILKILCSMKFSWDEEVPSEMKVQWEKWCADLEEMTKIEIPRCFKANVEREVVSSQLHMFSDASVNGYGVCGYLRQEDDDEFVDVTLVMAKSRVTPNKVTTIPRLELQAGVLSAKIGHFLKEELDVPDLKTYYWCDSKVTLGYVQNSSRRFHLYVTNRVAAIRERTDPENWFYVNTDENPADLCSRGTTVMELKDNEDWWYGPEFLVDFEEDDMKSEDYAVDEEDPELKTDKTNLQTKVEETVLMKKLKEISGWNRMKSYVAVWKRLIEILNSKPEDRRTLKKYPITVEELDDAEAEIIKEVQREGFPEVYDMMTKQASYPEGNYDAKKRNAVLRKFTNLYRLDIYMSENGVMKIGGRLQRSELSDELVHPSLLPKGHHVVTEVIRYFHDKAAHAGRGTTLTELRSHGIWIVHGRSEVDRVLRKCVRCRRLRGRNLEQRMSDLPKVRLDPAPPFTSTGMDVFGPFTVKTGRVVRKRWIVVFVCMVMRASHLEVIWSMDISSFLNAYRRMVARRGVVKKLYCDRGSNFVGSSNEMNAARDEMKLEEMQDGLKKEGCDMVQFDFNFPKSSHMGGSWERIIRILRGSLSCLLTTHGEQLDDEGFITLVAEAELIANSRPITYPDMTDAKDGVPLTPMQLLTLKSQIVKPLPGTFVQEDLYSRRRWRRVQYLANVFWSRWVKEFIPSLQERKKWHGPKENMQIGDIVLISEENAHRNDWKTGMIEQVYPGEDELVRKVDVRTSSGVLQRPIHKLVFLYRAASG